MYSIFHISSSHREGTYALTAVIFDPTLAKIWRNLQPGDLLWDVDTYDREIGIVLNPGIMIDNWRKGVQVFWVNFREGRQYVMMNEFNPAYVSLSPILPRVRNPKRVHFKR